MTRMFLKPGVVVVHYLETLPRIFHCCSIKFSIICSPLPPALFHKDGWCLALVRAGLLCWRNCKPIIQVFSSVNTVICPCAPRALAFWGQVMETSCWAWCKMSRKSTGSNRSQTAASIDSMLFSLYLGYFEISQPLNYYKEMEEKGYPLFLSQSLNERIVQLVKTDVRVDATKSMGEIQEGEHSCHLLVLFGGIF